METKEYLDILKKEGKRNKWNKTTNRILSEKELITELTNFDEAHYKLLEYNRDGVDKLLYVNKYDLNEVTFTNWVGWIFGLKDYQFKDLLAGRKVDDILMFTPLAGKYAPLKVIKIIKDLKILDSGTASMNPNIIERNNIYKFRNSKYFQKNDVLRFRIQHLTKAMLIPLGAIIWPMYASMQKEKF